ncbi:acyl-CoA thioesterase [bacterium]|nr:acyl-CoA thioesterase [bacterium]
MKNRFEVPLVIGEDQLDSEYLHLHHAEIYRVLERVRLQYLEGLGVPQEELLREDCFLVLAAAETEFLREVKAGELVGSVQVTSCSETGEVVLEQELFKAPRRLAVRATFRLVAMSGARRRRVSLPKRLFLAFSRDLEGEKSPG